MIVSIKTQKDFTLVVTRKVLTAKQQGIVKASHGLKGLVFFRLKTQVAEA